MKEFRKWLGRHATYDKTEDVYHIQNDSYGFYVGFYSDKVAIEADNHNYIFSGTPMKAKQFLEIILDIQN